MAKTTHPVIFNSQKIKQSRRTSRRVNLEDVSIALDQKNYSVIVAFFEQGYIPEKSPGWIKAVLGIDRLTKLEEKYYLWKTGIL